MTRRLVRVAAVCAFLFASGSLLALQIGEGSPKPENSRPLFIVQQAGGDSFMIDTLHGKTWMLRKQENNRAVWLPISKIDSEEEASRLWPKTKPYNLGTTKEHGEPKPISTLIKSQGFVCIPLDKLRIGYYGISVRLNGKKHYFILDSGQPLTHLDIERTKNLKLKWTSVDGPAEKNPKAAGLPTESLSTLDKLEIGGIEISQMVVGGHDLSAVNKVVKAYLDPLIDGEIGSDVLNKYSAIVDFSVPELYLRPRK